MKTETIFTVCVLLTGFANARTIEFDEQGPDVNIPTQIWEKFGNVSGKNTVTFGDIVVRLKEKNPGVLVEEELTFKFPRGGGEIDLSKYVKLDNPGSFYVFFEFEDLPKGEAGKAYFISRAKKRKIDQEVWGSGCNKYLDIKKFIYGEGLKSGIEVNTTRSRHLSVLGGTFFFANDSKVAQVSFKDTSQPQLMCEEEIKHP